nr:MAG TPA: hypothetical protein [Caudoviricetes sp.]
MAINIKIPLLIEMFRLRKSISQQKNLVNYRKGRSIK